MCKLYGDSVVGEYTFRLVILLSFWFSLDRIKLHLLYINSADMLKYVISKVNDLSKWLLMIQFSS